MEAYATALTYAIPGFIGLIIIEALAAWRMGVRINNSEDMISSLSSGMTNTLKSLLGLSVIIISYEWMVERLGIFDIRSATWLYILAFIGIDFASYWSHRFNHVINIFWNRHIVHHSSEEFNLSCALRQEISAIVGVYFFLYIPMALIGIPAKIVALVAPIHLFAQFWYHTRLIKRMGILEYILVTPSHHRVHHAINEKYIDKNYAAIFIIWDKWFGTFQEELPDEEPVYGTLKPVRTWNPVIINYMHFWQLLKDAWRTDDWIAKLKIWFMPTGWRPEDVIEKYPVEHIPVYHREKYKSRLSNSLKAWVWFRFITTNLLLYYMLTQFGNLGPGEVILYSIFIFTSIFGLTSLMDFHRIALLFEVFTAATGFIILGISASWFGLAEYIPGAGMGIFIYLTLIIAGSFYFLLFDKSSAPFKAVALREAYTEPYQD